MAECLALYPYQREDVSRLRDTLLRDRAAFLLNAPRTGKLIECIQTVEALGVSSALYVGPLHTLWNVQSEFRRWSGVAVEINPAEAPTGQGATPVVAVNTERLRQPSHWLFRRNWPLVILDEAHHYRGRQSQQTKGAIRLSRKAGCLILSTGTPLMNGRPSEIWTLLHLAAPDTWPSFWTFLADYGAQQVSIAGGQDSRCEWKKGAKLRLQEWLAPRSIQRTFASCRPDMPKRLPDQTIPLLLRELDPEHYNVYSELEQQWQVVVDGVSFAAPTKLALTTRLHQLAASPCNLDDRWGVGGKVRAIAAYLRDSPRKVIVYVWHRAMARAVAESSRLSQPWSYCRVVTGDVPAALRQQYCDEFQAVPPGRCALLVATIGSIGEGVSLDTADLVLFAEKSWVPDENTQAADRALGPARTTWPPVVSFVCMDTVEQDVEQVLASKERSTDSFMAMRAVAEARRARLGAVSAA